MSKQWKWTLAVVVALAWVAIVPSAEADPVAAVPGAAAADSSRCNLVDVRVSSDAEGRPIVTLDSDGKLEFESFVLDGPDRLVLDLPGVINRLDGQRFPVDHSGVLRVRAAQHSLDPKPVTRVVFDMQAPQPYSIDQVGSSLVIAFGEHAVQVATPAVQSAPSVITVAAIETPPASTSGVAEVVDELSARAAASEPRSDEAAPRRSVDPQAIDRLLQAPAFAAPQESTRTMEPAVPQEEEEEDLTRSLQPVAPQSFQSRRIVTSEVTYRGKRISLNLVDADIKQVFRLFHELSGLNFVLDPEVSGRVTIVLDQVPWDQALDIILKNNGLDKVLDNNVLRIASTKKLAEEAASRKRLREAEELEVEPITLTRTLSYATAKEVEKVIRDGGILSDRGKVIVDERTNTLIISDIPKKVSPLDTLITTLDAETPQVMIEARIVETSKNFSRDLGVVWDVAAIADASRGTATGLSFPHNVSGRYGLNLPGDGAASSLGFSFGNIVDSFTLDVALNALETEGRGRIISAPKIATQNNERAEIEQGVRIPVTNTTATEIQVEFVSASLLLSVTPQITAEGTVVLDVTVENNSPDFVNTAGGIPSIRTQRAQTKVLISDGGTTVIGGIFTVNEGDSEVGVPWFRKLPIFGWLFRTQSIQQENRELLIFLTPKIVKLS